MKDYLLRLYRYNQWCNLQLAEHLKSLPEMESLMLRLSHIVAAEEIWFDRIQSLDYPPLPLFEAQSLAMLLPRLEKSAQRWLNLVDHSDDFHRIISYETTQGTPYQTPLDEILIHVANHGTYHRGQIATLTRQAGHKPLATDYILFCRNLER